MSVTGSDDIVVERDNASPHPEEPTVKSQRKAKHGKGKQKKHYVDEKSELLSLAALASGVEASSASDKIAKVRDALAKNHWKPANPAFQARARIPKAKKEEPKPAKKPKPVKSSQIEKLKADIVAKTAHKKAKKRKAAKTNAASVRGQKQSHEQPLPRKGVKFA